MGKLLKRIEAIWYYFGRKDKELRDFAVGLSSEIDIKRDLHILFLDFDKVTLEEVEESVTEAQSFWNLSDCFIYGTRNGFHAYFFYDIMPYSRVLIIINYCKYVDDMFKFISRYYDYKTIRQSGKYKQQDIHFVKMMKGPRIPTLRETELGDLKRRERKYLAGIGNMFRKDKLKD
jgi:hypothetical protein